jgi:hypothetical protein
MRRTGAAAGPRRKGEPSLIPRRDIGRRYYGLSCRKPLRSGSGVLDFGGISWIGVVMAEDFDNKNVVLVAAIIGGVVFLLGFLAVVVKIL